MTSKHITRRRFLLLGGGTTLSAFVGRAYLRGGCPLSNSGTCVGPCAAFIDRNHDQICDRIQSDPLPVASDTAQTDPSAPSSTARGPHQASICPFGLVNDPYPGQCAHYVDKDNNGICDLSEVAEEAASGNVPAQETESEVTGSPATTVPPAPAQAAVACPFGLVNDPYPGECRHYVDKNGNGLCDLSEVVEEAVPGNVPAPAEESKVPASPTITAPPAPAQAAVACPFGLVNDPYPGECRRYIDRNGNGLCDLSEPIEGVSEQAEENQNSRGKGRHRGRNGS